MAEENTKKKRPQVNALYCTEIVADAVNNHSWFANCATGADRANKILEALNFAEEWKGREEELQNSDAQINSLQQQIEDLKDSHAKEVERLQGELSEAKSQLTDGDADMQSVLADKQKAEQERDELQRKLDAITAEAGSKTGWDLVKASIDPAYAAVLEELTKRLIEKFNIPDLEPQTVLITFFMQYYYNQEWEFSGMPFIMKQTEILEIVQGVYPEMTAKVLRQALQVRKK